VISGELVSSRRFLFFTFLRSLCFRSFRFRFLPFADRRVDVDHDAVAYCRQDFVFLPIEGAWPYLPSFQIAHRFLLIPFWGLF